MALPSSVPSNSTHLFQTGFTVPPNGGGAFMQFTTQVVITNANTTASSVQIYVVLDVSGSSSQLVDALPIVFPPNTTRQDATNIYAGLNPGNHTLDVYAYTNVPNITQVWSRLIGTLYFA